MFVASDRLRLEVVAAPLTAADAWTRHSSSWDEVEDRKAAFRRLERMRQGHLADGLISDVWGKDKSVGRVLAREAQELMTFDSGRLFLWRGSGKEFDAISVLRWRWASLVLPAMVWRALAMTGRSEPVPESVELLGDRWRTTPTAHLHVHHSQVPNFDALWHGLASLALKSGHVSVVNSKQRVNGEALATGWRIWAAARFLSGAQASFPSGLDDVDHLFIRGEVPPLDSLRSPLRGGHPRVPGPWGNAIRQALDSDVDAIRLGGVQALRVICAVFGEMTFDQTESGMAAYERKHAALTDLGMVPVPKVVAAERELAVRVAEVRRSLHPDDRLGRVTGSVDCEAVMIVGFLRRSEDPPPGQPQFSANVRRHDACVRTVERALYQPEARTYLVGVDLAGSEALEPLWVAAPFMRRARDLLAKNQCRGTGLTLHVGEQVHNPLSALRRILEAFVWRLVQAGDRLGHATVLGLDLERLLRAQVQASATRWDLLCDLASLSAYVRLSDGVDEYIERVISYVSGGAVDVRGSDWVTLWRRLGHDAVAAFWPFTSTSPVTHSQFRANPAFDFFSGLLTDRTWFGRAQEVVSVDLLRFRHGILRMQNDLHRRVRAGRVTVEINPTSNMLISGSNMPLEQPHFWRRSRIPIAVSADCPLAFSTSLSAEVAFARAGMAVVGGLKPRAINRWTEQVLQAGLQASFRVSNDPHVRSGMA